MKKVFTIIFLIIMSCFQCFVYAQNIETVQRSTGKVLSVQYMDMNENEYLQVKQIAEIKLLQGTFKGQIVNIDNIITGNPLYDINLKKGMKVLVNIEHSDKGYHFDIEEIERANILVYLSLLFCTLLIYVGRKKGFYSLISIAVTCLLIFYLLSFLIISGVNPIFSAMLVCVLSTIITMYLVGGINKKSTSATLGCILSIFVAGLLAFLTVKAAHLSGFVDETSMFLYSAHPELNFKNIIISVILLATLGAVMDVSMSIASTINEIYEVDNTKTIKELFHSGMNVGRDIIGTMANTLIFVYLGSSLPLLLLASNIDLQKFINLNQVVTEISSAIIGSCAIVICVPLTAFVTSNLIKRTKGHL